jgi:hypothetical protein
MRRAFLAALLILFCSSVLNAQKGKAEADYYPLGYPGDTWTGEVTAFDNDQRTLTLTYGKDKLTLIAKIPDAPYEWTRNGHNERVLDFPYDPKVKTQVFKYESGEVSAGSLLPEGDESNGMRRRPNPPDANRITDLSDFLGRTITVYYTSRERKDATGKVKFNDVWRIKVLPKKKQ